jgi:hypothetical protein
MNLETKYNEALAEILNIRRNEAKRYFKDQRHLKHLLEFEAWISEQKLVLMFAQADLMTNPKLKERVEKAQTYYENQLKAFTYTAELFTLMNFHEIKRFEYEQANLELSDKIRQLENEVNRLNSLNNF